VRAIGSTVQLFGDICKQCNAAVIEKEKKRSGLEISALM
jgi:hypothetical protein